MFIFNDYHEPTREMVNKQLEIMIRTINLEPIEVSCVYEKQGLMRTYFFKLDKNEMKELIKIVSSDNLELEGNKITGQFMKKIFLV